jgi:hypothetical protein
MFNRQRSVENRNRESIIIIVVGSGRSWWELRGLLRHIRPRGLIKESLSTANSERLRARRDRVVTLKIAFESEL